MRTVRLSRELLARIERAARDGYPEEACGFLFSAEDGADAPARTVRSVEAAPNVVEGERRRRFVISPAELRSAEVRASTRAEVVSGFYHSHPDHPALPSAFDTEHAWPWYTYLIVSVEAGGVRAIGAFEFDERPRRLVPCPVEIGADRADSTAQGPALVAPE